MKTNQIADMIGFEIKKVHDKVYRQKRPQTADYPYIVYRLETVLPTYPSRDMYLNVDLYENPTASVRDIEDMADLIGAQLSQRVLIEDGVNLQIELDTRQSVDAKALIDAYMINLRFIIRAYT